MFVVLFVVDSFVGIFVDFVDFVCGVWGDFFGEVCDFV